MWRQIGGYDDFSKKPIKVIHSSPLREDKSFLKGLIYFTDIANYKAKILRIDYAMQGMAVFSEKMKKGWRGSNESCQDAYEEVIITNCRKRKLPDAMKRYEIREEIIYTNLVERLQIVMMQLQWKISI